MSKETTTEKSDRLLRKLRLCQQIARLVRARMPIAGQLGELATQYPDVPADLAKEVNDRLEAGYSLADALAGGQSLNSRSLAGCILAGERGQCLDATLDAWAEMQLDNIRSRRSIFINLLYPAVLIVTAFSAIFLLVDRVVPMYVSIYEQLEHELPNWLQPVIWCHEHLWWLTLVLVVLFLLPALYILRQQRGTDRHGLPHNKLHRQRLYALSSGVAGRLLESGLPLDQTVQFSSQAAGMSTEAASRDVGCLLNNEKMKSLAPEASLLLNSVHSGLIPPEDAAKNLQQTANLYSQSAQESSKARARRIPVLIACAVGLTIMGVYAGLIYAPWVQLLLDLTKPPGQ